MFGETSASDLHSSNSLVKQLQSREIVNASSEILVRFHSKTQTVEVPQPSRGVCQITSADSFGVFLQELALVRISVNDIIDTEKKLLGKSNEPPPPRQFGIWSHALLSSGVLSHAGCVILGTTRDAQFLISYTSRDSEYELQVRQPTSLLVWT